MESRKELKHLGKGLYVIEDLGIYFHDFQLGHLGFTYQVGGKKAVEIIFNEFCCLDGLKLRRKDNPDVFVRLDTFYVKNGRRVYHF